MKKKYTTKKKNMGHMFVDLIVERDSNSRHVISKTNSNIINEVMKENNIDISNVNSLYIHRDKNKIIIEIEYCKINIADIAIIEDKEQQIRKVLDFYGYHEKHITEVFYDKADKMWRASVYSGYDSSQSFLAKSDENLLNIEMKKILGFDVEVSIS